MTAGLAAVAFLVLWCIGTVTVIGRLVLDGLKRLNEKVEKASRDRCPDEIERTGD